MIAWKTLLKPAEMAQVSSYVLQFQGTIPAEPKVAEGDIWVDEAVSEASETTTEVIETVIDSIQTQE